MSSTLNEPQMSAVLHPGGPLLLFAGAGSGKTRTIAYRVAHLVAEHGVPPYRILAVTFTNKAAQEMRERLESLAGESIARDLWIGTFHGVCVKFLRRHYDAAGLKSSFVIYDDSDQKALVQRTIKALDLDDREYPAKMVLSRISMLKREGKDPISTPLTGGIDDTLDTLAREYQTLLNRASAIDFDDILLYALRIVEDPDSPSGRELRKKFEHVLVDEFQDTNWVQYRLVRALAASHRNLCVVGDDDQSIYRWRGADVRIIRGFKSDFPEAQVIKLEQNYRSSATILAAANRLIDHNPKLHPKKLWSELGVGDPIHVVPCDDEEAEAETVVMRLQAMKFERRAAFSDFAILYRGNHQARVIEQALRKENIPYALSGGQSFFERAEIRDLIAYLRLLANEDDDPAFIRAITTPRRGIGNATLAALGSYAGERRVSMFEALFETGFESRVGARQLADLREFGAFVNRMQERAPREPAGELFDHLLSAIGYRDYLYDNNDEKVAASRWQNVCDFGDWLKKRAEKDEADLVALSQTIALLTQLDGRREDGDVVRMSTIHAAKGLEYPHVFLVGCEEGVMPHHGGLSADEVVAEAEAASAGEAPSDEVRARRIEEERRLMYVAVTRAQRSLTLTWCRTRKRGRDKLLQMPSRFIAEMRLEAMPPSRATVSAEAARGKLGALKAMLANRG